MYTKTINKNNQSIIVPILNFIAIRVLFYFDDANLKVIELVQTRDCDIALEHFRCLIEIVYESSNFSNTAMKKCPMFLAIVRQISVDNNNYILYVFAKRYVYSNYQILYVASEIVDIFFKII